jgi:hypothetical protein
MTGSGSGSGSGVPGRPDHAGTAVGVTVTAGGARAYAKLGVFLLSVIGQAVVALLDGGGSAAEWCQVAATAASAAGVWIASNTVPGARYAKVVCAAAGAVLAVLIPVLLEGGDGFTGATGVNMLLAVAGALGVWAVPNVTAGGENVLAVADRLAG